MELILKLPQNKPPFIGLVYPDYDSAVAYCEYLLDIQQTRSIALKIRLDNHKYVLTILVDYKDDKTINIKTNPFLLVKEHRKFENAPSVNFGPIIKKGNGEYSPVWSEKYQKWTVVQLQMVVFYFRNHF
jgi:hypothetical protein